MGAPVAWVAALGVATAAACWQILSWTEADVTWIASMARVAMRAGRTFLDTASARLMPGRASRGERRASLGDVSEMIDVVRLGLTAGLSFDAALDLYCANRATPLARRMKRAELAWRCGMGTREEELAEVSRDVGVRALESFAIAVRQALALGAPLADVLAAQEREIRAARRSEVERAIEQAPVKLLIPTGTLILPALLLSILGPLLAASGML